MVEKWSLLVECKFVFEDCCFFVVGNRTISQSENHILDEWGENE